MPVSAANKKICIECGADVTFARRASDPKGRYLCLTCAKALEKSRIAASAPVAAATAEGGDDLRLLAQLAPTKTEAPNASAQAIPRPVQPKLANRPEPRSKEPILWITGGFIVVLVLIIAFVMMGRKTWEQQNRPQIMSMKSDADSLLKSGQPKAVLRSLQGAFCVRP